MRSGRRSDGRRAPPTSATRSTARGQAGLDANPGPLVARLDWLRSYKDEYELRCASRRRPRSAPARHARRARGLRRGWLRAGDPPRLRAAPPRRPRRSCPTPRSWRSTRRPRRCTTRGSARARRTRAAARRRGRLSRLRLRHHAHDAGAVGCDPRFVALVALVDGLERELARAATPGRPYVDAAPPGAPRRRPRAARPRRPARAARRRRSRRASPTPSSRTASATTSASRCTTWRGARRIAPGRRPRRRSEYPFLRNTRPIEPGQVFTIEPGIYFIPMLLRPLRGGPQAGAIDWSLIDALTPLGGVRVEDNVLVTAAGPRNLTREAAARLRASPRRPPCAARRRARRAATRCRGTAGELVRPARRQPSAGCA